MGQFFFDQMFNLGGAAVTTLTAMNANTTSAAGGYSPKLDGTLLKLTIKVSPQAASSLAQSGYVSLNCPTWTLNSQIFPFNGFGLATAPQAVGGTTFDTLYPPAGDGFLNLPVTTSVPITGSVIYFYSPVTPNIVVEGMFSSSK